jgi:hypothetical protein
VISGLRPCGPVLLLLILLVVLVPRFAIGLAAEEGWKMLLLEKVGENLGNFLSACVVMDGRPS